MTLKSLLRELQLEALNPVYGSVSGCAGRVDLALVRISSSNGLNDG
jgi:hypothetical protein